MLQTLFITLLGPVLAPLPSPPRDYQSLVQPGMTLDQVVELIDHPHYGYDACGDRTYGFRSALYLKPRIYIKYRWDIVIEVSPPYRPAAPMK